jgi:DNA-binding winged helix-turn-helix (wHTH) protein
MTVTFGAFTLDVPRRLVTRDGAEVHLTPKAYDLLHLLVTEAPRVLTKSELHDRLWTQAFVSDATLTGLVKELRKALDDSNRSAPLIRTVHGVGYAFCGTVAGAPTSQGEVAAHWLIMRGRRIALHQGSNVVGRDPTAEVWLDASGVSRRHARIEVSNATVTLEDLGSKNGTTVDGALIDKPVTLNDGDQIGFGATPCVYRAARSGMSTETRATRIAPPRQGPR